ncbi:putative aarF domain-containing protein kinase 1 [Gracilariopsis chorda]|uniref:Putative aarF domain-containing protein kinase 1 n=1 Tax=Gracilariopsis chorda TaxID=448386 RepID=A0A2V3IWF3_9FLOR|nr:putative aarF domain-containing protein kinase 1 [Gracilariopsis chorda]|eukprot:PXF46419.1 putative aarF domain-containing protein kinase 1 [Gracilariopsis chorda]
MAPLSVRRAVPKSAQLLSRLPIRRANLPATLILTPALALTQSLLGPPRWNILQSLIVLSATNLPFLPLLRPFLLPLCSTWIYALLSRLFAPAHARSLRFWKRVIPIYAAYKKTQISLSLQNASPHTRTKRWNKRHLWGAEKVYNLCVELRGFYLKDGQFLGARTDLVPMAWCDSLRRLQDRVPPVPFSQIQATIRQSYNVNNLTQIFKSLNHTPLASATIAQVHRGQMPDGTPIVLKTQYKDQQHLCDMDLLNLKRLANFLQKHDMSFFDMHSVVTEFETQIPAEFDFVREAELMTIIRQNLTAAGIFDVIVPTVIPGLVSKRALTMTYVDGCRPDNTVAMNLWGVKPNLVLKAVGKAFGQMLLVDGLAHCDPHLGNLIIMRDGRVALIDFGQAKHIPEQLRTKLCAFYLALNSKNNLFILKTFSELGIELDIRPEDIDDKFIQMIPHYANGMLDTAPLPPEIEINPFSSESPLKQVPIKKFNPDLFMVLRTMGLLRSLTETLNVETIDCWMSTIFKPYAMRGIRRSGPTLSEKRKRSRTIRSALTKGVSSPFYTLDAEPSEFCALA